MTVYKNSNEDSILASLDFDDNHKAGFFFVKNEVDVEVAKTLLKNAEQTIVAQSYVKGRTVIITQGEDDKAALFTKLAAEGGGNFEPVQPEKPTFLQFLRTNGWKIRGGSSVVGQSMTLFSAFNAVSKADADAGRLNPKFDPSIGAFATLNLAANFINYVFGGQKEEDVKGLEKFDGIIADEINHYLPSEAEQVSPDEVRKLSYMDEKELAEHNKSRSAAGILRHNSVRIGEVGLRTLGSLCMVFNYKKVLPGLKKLGAGELKEAFLTAKVEDKNTFLAGCGMVAGKAMGLLATTYDPNNPPKTYTDEIRQKVLWTTSSFTEMVAQSFVVFDRAKNKRLVLGGKAHQDMTGIVGNALLTVPPYPVRLVLPYGEKVLDVDEVQARLLDELHLIPKDKIPQVAARVTARMVEHMGNKSPSFSALYKEVLHKLHEFHKVNILPEADEEHVGQSTLFRDKVVSKNESLTNDTDRNIAPSNPIKNIINRTHDLNQTPAQIA